MSSVKHRASQPAHADLGVRLGAKSARAALGLAGIAGLLLVGSQAVSASTHQSAARANTYPSHFDGEHHHRPPIRPTSSAPAPSVSPIKTSVAAGSTAPRTSASSSSAASSTAASSSTASKPASSTSSSTSAPPAGGATAGSSTHNCVAAPAACGYPDASNTGVPAGTTLKSVPGQVSSGPGWHWDSRGWVAIDGTNAIFTGYSVTANLNVTATNATISNNKITLGGDDFGIALRHTHNAIISHNTITGLASTGNGRLMNGIKDIYGDATGTQIIANNIARTATGVQMDGGLIADNYIHDLGLTGADHVNGTTSNGTNGQQLIIRHNTVLDPWDQTDAISLFQDFSPQTNRIIDNNLLSGGSYSLYAGQQDGGSTTSNIKITNNRFASNYYPNGGYFGTIAHYDNNGPGNVWTNNFLDSSGAGITP